MALPSIYYRIGYDPYLDLDMIETGRTKQTGYKPIKPTCAIRDGLLPGQVDYYIHGNSKVTPYENGRDVSKQYHLLRLRHNWDAYATELTAGVGRPTTWGRDDHRGDNEWYDAPGQKFKVLTPFRYLQEFIVGVSELYDPESVVPAFGGLYFIVAVDIMPRHHRVWMSLPRLLTADEIKGVFGSPHRRFPHNVVSPRAPQLSAWKWVPTLWLTYFPDERHGGVPDLGAALP